MLGLNPKLSGPQPRDSLHEQKQGRYEAVEGRECDENTEEEPGSSVDYLDSKLDSAQLFCLVKSALLNLVFDIGIFIVEPRFRVASSVVVL